MDYTDVTHPVYATAGGSAISCLVTFTQFAQPVPFLAMASDPEPHGQRIFAELAAGKYGPVLDFQPPPRDVLAGTVRSARNALLSACDWTQGADIPATTRAAWQPYRQALRDITRQTGFPLDIHWPDAPSGA